MEYLKKFVTVNLYSIFGYYLFYQLLIAFYYHNMAYMLHPITACMVFIFYFSVIKKFLIAFGIEFAVTFLIKKIFKREISLNIDNKIYDFVFRLGILFTFLPVIVIGTMYFLVFIGSIIKLVDSPCYSDFAWIITLILFYTAVLDFFIKIIFKKNN